MCLEITITTMRKGVPLECAKPTHLFNIIIIIIIIIIDNKKIKTDKDTDTNKGSSQLPQQIFFWLR